MMTGISDLDLGRICPRLGTGPWLPLLSDEVSVTGAPNVLECNSPREVDHKVSKLRLSALGRFSW